MIDIDNFKKVNDSEGHSAGDQVLVKLADILAKNIRVSDSIGRWGGEEFLIICPDTDSSHAGVLAEKLRKIIEKLIFNLLLFVLQVSGYQKLILMKKNMIFFKEQIKRFMSQKLLTKTELQCFKK